METQPAKQASEPYFDIGMATPSLDFEVLLLMFRVLQ